MRAAITPIAGSVTATVFQVWGPNDPAYAVAAWGVVAVLWIFWLVTREPVARILFPVQMSAKPSTGTKGKATTFARLPPWLFGFVAPVGSFVTLLTLAVVFDVAGQRPRLRIDLRHMSVIQPGNDWDPPAHGAAILVVLSIRNTGMPSIVEGCIFDVRLPNGYTMHGESVTPTETMRLTSGAVYARSDFLSDRTAHTPIPRGGRVIGAALFEFEGTTPDTVAVPGSDMIVSCEDVVGRVVRASHRWLAPRGNDRIYSFPGLTPPHIPPPGR